MPHTEAMSIAECRKPAFTVAFDTMPPSLNNLYASITVKGVTRRVMSNSARVWKDGAVLVIRNAGRLRGFDIAPKQPFAIEMVYTAPNVLVWDLDGKAKILVDSFCDAFGVDDRYLMELRQRKQRGAVNVHMTVTLL